MGLDVTGLSIRDVDQTFVIGQVGVVVDDVVFDDSAVVKRQHALVPVNVTLQKAVRVSNLKRIGYMT